MDYRRVIFVLLMMLPFLSRGQEYKVVSFEPALKDLTARTATTARVDDNGRKCAVIKVYDNISEAIKWYENAAAQGDQFAKDMLKQLKK